MSAIQENKRQQRLEQQRQHKLRMQQMRAQSGAGSPPPPLHPRAHSRSPPPHPRAHSISPPPHPRAHSRSPPPHPRAHSRSPPSTKSQAERWHEYQKRQEYIKHKQLAGTNPSTQQIFQQNKIRSKYQKERRHQQMLRKQQQEIRQQKYAVQMRQQETMEQLKEAEEAAIKLRRLHEEAQLQREEARIETIEAKLAVKKIEAEQVQKDAVRAAHQIEAKAISRMASASKIEKEIAKKRAEVERQRLLAEREQKRLQDLEKDLITVKVEVESIKSDTSKIMTHLQRAEEEHARRIEEQRRIEEERHIEEQRRIEERRRIEEERRIEEQRYREEQRRREEQRNAEAQKKFALEQKYREEKRREYEEAARAEAQKRAAEEKRRVEEKRRAEEKRRVEEKRHAEAKKRRAEEQRRAEEKRRVEEKRRADEKRLAEEKRRVEEKRRAEAKRLAEAKKRRADEQKRYAEEQRRAEEQKRRAEEQKHRAEEQKRRVEEQKRRAEEQKRRVEEQKRRAEEQKRLAEEQKRRAEEQKRAEAAAKERMIPRIKLFTDPLVINMIEPLKMMMEKKGFVCELVRRAMQEADITNKTNELYFISNFQNIKILPRNVARCLPPNRYILYQLEQLHMYNQMPLFHGKNINLIKSSEMWTLVENSAITFDYHGTNLKYYPEHVRKKVQILPFTIPEAVATYSDIKLYDILFYGSMNSRRKIILSELSKQFKIKIVQNIHGQSLSNLIQQSCIVLNLHFYPDALLETARLHEALPYNVDIISEKSSAGMQDYKDVVTFIDPIEYDLTHLDTLRDQIQTSLDNAEKERFNLTWSKWKKKAASVRKLKASIREKVAKKFSDCFFFLTPHLFHKYILGLANPENTITYTTIRQPIENRHQNKLFAHLHCFDIDQFDTIYGEHITMLCKYFTVIVTYSKGAIRQFQNRLILLHIHNKGQDIGAKFCMVQYLKDRNIDYNYILFLHSKLNSDTRKKYFAPFLNLFEDEQTAEEFIENIHNYDGYFPDIQWEIQGNALNMITGNPQFANKKLPERNNLYRRELLDYLKCNNRTNRFVEGNVYLLSKKVVERLFGDTKLYNILNRPQDFDYNWMCQRYGLRGNIQEVYNECIQKRLPLRDKLSYDGYIEHAFERIMLNLCEHNKYKLINKDITLIGLKNINCSISENVYLLKKYLENKKFNSINIYDINNLNNINYNSSKTIFSETIFCLQPFELKQFLPQLKKFKIKPSVLWVWEFKSLPYIFKEYEKYFRKVYVPSQFCYDVFYKHLSIPIEKINLKSKIHEYIDKIPNHNITNRLVNTILEKSANKIKYGYCFDLNSSIVRKNPLNLVKAFSRIDNENIVLILKFRKPRAQFVNKIEYDIFHECIKISTSAQNIYLIDQELEPLDLYKLYTNFDYYISPHCGEGFGFTIYNNMILGNKIISPYYSGEKDYLKKEGIIELEYEEKEINGLRQHPVYGQMKDFKGAYISVESIEKCLKIIVESDIIYMLGNGPSLKNCDFKFLKDNTTFALNSSYKKFKELDFYPTYFGCFDPKLIECHYDKFVQLMNDKNKIKKFFFLNENNKGKKQFSSQDENNSRYQKIKFFPPQKTYMNTTSFNKFYKMHNSGATAALISIILGYKKIILLGCDGNYVEQIPQAKMIDASTKTLQILETPKKNPNYWFDNYQEKGEIYSVPDGNSCHMKGWELLYQASKIHNVEIINGSIISKIPYFSKEVKYFLPFLSQEDNIIVTLVNNKYFEGCLTFIQSVQMQMFDIKIIVFYFDLDIKFISILKYLHNVSIISINNEKNDKLEDKHCQGYFIKTKLILYCYENIKKNILYFDSTIVLQKSMSCIFDIIDKQNFFFLDHSDRPINNHDILNINCFHKDFINKYNINEEILLRKHINSGLFGFNNKKYNKILEDFMKDLKDINIFENYIRPKFENIPLHTKYNSLVDIKSYIGCRQDQSILSYLNGKYRLKYYSSIIYKYSIDRGASKRNYEITQSLDKNKIIQKLLNKKSFFQRNNIDNEYSKKAYSLCSRLDFIDYDNIKFKKIIDIICVTLGKRDFDKYLQKFIEINNYELINLIIIDDSGELEKICKKDMYKKINYKYKHVKKPLIDCFIEGSKLIETNYTMWLNDDDYIVNPNFLKIVLENIIKYPNIDVFYGKGYYKNYITKEIKKSFCSNSLEINPYIHFTNCYGMLQPSTFFKKELNSTFKDVIYDSIFDVNFFVLNINKNFKFINEDMSEATINNNTITDLQKEKQLISHFHLLLDQNIIPDKVIYNNINGLLNNKNRLTTHLELSPEYTQKLISFVKYYLNYRFTNKKDAIMDIYNAKINNIEHNSQKLIEYKKTIERSFYLNNNLNKRKILVIGNGPSTKKLNFNNLEKNIITIGMNSAYRYWYKIKWFPDIYISLDHVVAESHYENIMELLKIDKIKIFFLHDILLKKNKHLRQNKKIIFLSDLHYKYNIFNNGMLTTGAYSIRLAIFLGFYNIDFIGIDCNYTNYIMGSKKLENSKLIISEDINTNQNYFFDDYQQKGDIYQVPDVNKDFHLRCINSIYNDLENLKVKLNIVNLGTNKNILFK